ncbi:flagellar hook-length control protein FliK [Paenisporosarcina sp. TG-14]|uniref:flagellar hook-length control protein FliK n=1 Tax=Paenisporosarcina sp. TG-14 TaxID=1231057 RepID=UPI00178C226C|nr:flagellar hook-length control protein FliK [Paenisporosarcina sp. TG-14]
MSTEKETVNFAELFGTVTAEGEIESEKIASENQQGELLKKLLEKLDEVVKALEELPSESLSQDEQDMMYSSVQMLSLQTTQLKEKLQEPSSLQEKVMLLSPTQEKLMKNLLQSSELQEKLMTIIRLVNQNMQQVTVANTKQFESGPEIVGVEGRTDLSSLIKFEQAFKQLVTFIQHFQTEQQATGKQISFKQMEQQLTNLTQHIENHTQVTESKRNAIQNIENSLLQPINTTIKPRESDGLIVEPILSEESSQVALTGPQLNGAKESQASGRAEPSVPTPSVRMSNIIEELGEVLRGSLRLSGNPEGTRIRVNLFPEHLGHLEILLTASNGKIAAQIMTSNLVAKEAIELQVNQLRSSMLQQGIVIEKIEITQQSSQQSMGHQHAQPDQRFSQHQQKQGTASRDKKGYQRLEEEVETQRNQLVEGSMKVDYTV